MKKIRSIYFIFFFLIGNLLKKTFYEKTCYSKGGKFGWELVEVEKTCYSKVEKFGWELVENSV